jgi:general stress protein 26
MSSARITTAELLQFMRENFLAVQASVSAVAAPQAAVVGFVVTDRFELFFDTIDTTRKVQNLRQNPRIAFVIGGLTNGDERTVQYEGVADEPTGSELGRLKAAYFEVFKDGPERQSWAGITYVRVRPRWIRYSDFNQSPPLIVEFTARQLEAPD